MAVKYLEGIGLSGFEVLINTVGTVEDKNNYGKQLRDFLKDKTTDLCPNCKSRYQRNVLRILDCKVRECKQIIKNAPSIIDSLSDESQNDFNEFKEALDLIGIKYKACPNLVRGLDYYTKTVFEITHSNLGAQNTVLAGGRYDNLVAELGGKPTGAIGFACGVERLMLCLEAEKVSIPKKDNRGLKSCFLIGLGDSAYKQVFKLSQELRNAGITVFLDFQKRSLKAQMRQANKLECTFVLILGEEELEMNQIQLKDMRDSSQEIAKLSEISAILANKT